MQKAFIALSVLWMGACAVTTHPTTKSQLGVARGSAEMFAVINEPGPIVLETVSSADWVVPRGGLINLDHPKAKAAGLTDGDEPIKVYFHALRHPSHGLFIVDTGVEKALRDDPDRAAIRGLVTTAMHLDKMRFEQPLGDWLSKQSGPLQGVFLTHLHLDHVTGMGDVPRGTPVYTGPGEADASAFLHMFVQGSADRALEGKPALREWAHRPDPQDRFAGVLDVFGDGSLWALWVPGHTPGSTAFLARTPQGPVLLTGDACHTRWGWEHQVEPGSFTADGPEHVKTLAQLHRLVAEHPSIDVRLGHQP